MAESLRWRVSQWADKAKEETGRPSAGDVEKLKATWAERKELSDKIPGMYDLKWNRADPDWTSWSSVADCFEKYHDALVAKDNMNSSGMAAIRMRDT